MTYKYEMTKSEFEKTLNPDQLDWFQTYDLKMQVQISTSKGRAEKAESDLSWTIYPDRMGQ